jgi:cysteinyl-tRNA synthetase
MPVEDYAPVRRPAGQSLRSRSEIDRLVAQRLAARQVLDWGRADRLQRILAKNGIRLRDNGGETVWRQGKRQGQVKALKSPP